jgi:hypothetical protein
MRRPLPPADHGSRRRVLRQPRERAAERGPRGISTRAPHHSVAAGRRRPSALEPGIPDRLSPIFSLLSPVSHLPTQWNGVAGPACFPGRAFAPLAPARGTSRLPAGQACPSACRDRGSRLVPMPALAPDDSPRRARWTQRDSFTPRRQNTEQALVVNGKPWDRRRTTGEWILGASAVEIERGRLRRDRLLFVVS